VHADLRCGETDAVRFVHALGQVVAQLADLGVDLADGLGLLLQAGVGPDQDFTQRHALSLLVHATRR